jgi:uncharacterized protein with ParB-like and HNH nuclease domain
MKINCFDKQVGQFLSEAYYKIPRFQRAYSWDHVNVEEFWNDTVVESETDYFIGSFVVYDDKGTLGVVDGQQRITTITLLLCALRDALAGCGKTRFEADAVPRNSLVFTAQPDKKKACVEKTSSSWMCLAT